MPLALSALRSSSFFLVQARMPCASSPHSLNTSIERRTCLPSGESLKLLTSSAYDVSVCAAPPFAPTRQTCATLSLGARKYTLPSFDQRGLVALSALSVNRTALPPPVGTIQIPLVPLLAS